MEVFGPVTCIYVVAGFEEALAKADDTAYGLTAAVHTRDMDRARAFVDHLQAGMVTINGPTYGSEPHTPFGGFRLSGNGSREGGTEVLDFYSDWKAIHTWTSPQP
jgi:aldehyde dehydrogenase (NAD+)